MKTKRCTELKICDLAKTIDDMCPIKIFINRKLMWDDKIDDLESFRKILSKENFVRQLRFDVVDFHHSILYIETTTKGIY